MHSLSISQIFAQFSYYQAHYAQIIADPARYHIAVEDAYLEVYPFGRIALQLGDVLQLWLSQHWTVSPSHDLISPPQYAVDGQNQQFIYQIRANLFTGQHQARLWDQRRFESQSTKIDSLLKYCLTYYLRNKPRYRAQLCC